MKIQFTISILLVFGAIIAQDSPAATESSAVDALNAANNARVNSDLKQKYNEEYDQFTQDLNAIIERQNNNNKVKEVGDYKITVQTDCDYKIDLKPPVLTKFEKECYSAKSTAEATADMIVNTAPQNPPSFASVKGALTNCKLEVSVSKSFSIYNNCWADEFASEYKAIMDGYAGRMSQAGFVNRTDNDDGSVTFSSNELTRTVNLEDEHTAVEADNGSPASKPLPLE